MSFRILVGLLVLCSVGEQVWAKPPKVTNAVLKEVLSRRDLLDCFPKKKKKTPCKIELTLYRKGKYYALVDAACTGWEDSELKGKWFEKKGVVSLKGKEIVQEPDDGESRRTSYTSHKKNLTLSFAAASIILRGYSDPDDGDIKIPYACKRRKKPPTNNNALNSLLAKIDAQTSSAKALPLVRKARKGFGKRYRRAIAKVANGLGHRFYQAKKFDDALPLVREAAAIDPSYGMPRYNAARIYALKGNVKQCVVYLTQLKRMGRSQRKRFNYAKKDQAFRKVWNAPMFKALYR